MKQKLSSLFSEKKNHRLFLSEKGVALILTLVMVSLLTGWALSLNLKVRNNVIETIGLNKRLSLYDRASSGVDIAKLILIKDKKGSQSDSLHEFWADQEMIDKYLLKLGFSKDELQLNIIDQLSKIQINALVNYPNSKNASQVKLWERFLDGLRTKFPDLITNPYDIINPLLDWLDYGDDDAITGLSGAETSYYESEKSLYMPRNGPIKSIEEISLTKGITEKLWYNAGISAIALEYLTIDGIVKRSGKSYNYEGKININTASHPVISALIKDKAYLHMAQEIVSYRDEKSQGKFIHKLEGEWYKKCPGCEDVPIQDNIITTSSDIFRIVSKAFDGKISVEIDCVVKRIKTDDGKWDCQVIRWVTN